MIISKPTCKIIKTQLPAAIILGLLTDAWSFLLQGLATSSFATRIFCIIIGSLLLAIVSYIQVETHVTLLPADGLTNAIRHHTMLFKTNHFQIVDMICLVLGATLALILKQKLYGIGMATIVPLFLIPYFICLIQQGIINLEESGFF